MPGQAIPLPGEFMGGSANAGYALPPNYGVPGPAVANIEGSGGAPSPGAGLISGFAAGQNLANNAVAGYRGRKEYQQQQQTRTDAQAQALHDLSGPGALPPPAPAAHQGFISSLGQGLQHLGAGISNFFTQGAPGLEKGGEMPEFAAAPPPGAPQGFADGGAVPANYGVPPPTATNVQGSGGAPSPGAGLVSGIAAGQNLANNAVANYRGGQQYQADQGSRQDAQSYALAATDAGHQQGIEDYAAHLHDGALNDAGVPNGKQGLPNSPNPAEAVQQAAANPAAQRGVPEQAPQGAHSLSADYWDKSDQLMAKAVASAARAGHDPEQTFNALSNLRTSFIQGHILRNLAAANVALANGDMKGVEKGLKDVNYYLPNGQDLKLQKDANGGLVYQNPIYPWLDAKGNPGETQSKDGQPNMIPVDAAHLQMLGTAALDPMKVNDLVMGARSAIAKQRLEQAQAGAQVMTGQGRFMTGQARLQDAQARLGLVHSQNYKNLSGADLDRARAAHLGWLDMQIKSGHGGKLDPAAEKGAESAAKEVDTQIQGALATVPLQVKDKHGNMIDNLSPMAGKTTRDPTKSLFPNATPEQIVGMKATAADLFLSNAHDGMSASHAAQVAVQIEQGKRKTHPGPGGKSQPDVMIDRTKGVGHVWDGKTKTWTPFRIGAQRASALIANGGEAPSAEQLMADQDSMTGASGNVEGVLPNSPGSDEETVGGSESEG